MNPMTPIRVLLVDDHPDFLQSLSDFLSGVPWITLVGTARSGEEALVLVNDLRPDLVLMDLSMSGMNGMEATHRIKELEHPPRVVIVTLQHDPEYRAQAAASGANGFINKLDIVEGLPLLIRTLFTGNGIT